MKNILLIISLSILFAGCDTISGPIDATPPSFEEPEEKTFSEKVIDFKTEQECDQLLEKATEESTIEICYLYEKKGAKFVFYSLDSTYIDLNNLTDRPYFQSDEEIPEEYRTSYSDYTNSGYDRGHMAPDADFDYEENDLKQTYILSNIVMQDPTVNQEQWVEAENRERELTRLQGQVNVLNIIEYSTVKYNGITIPSRFYKIIYNDSFQECYLYENEVIGDPGSDYLEKHLINCNEIF